MVVALLILYLHSRQAYDDGRWSLWCRLCTGGETLKWITLIKRRLKKGRINPLEHSYISLMCQQYEYARCNPGLWRPDFQVAFHKVLATITSLFSQKVNMGLWLFLPWINRDVYHHMLMDTHSETHTHMWQFIAYNWHSPWQQLSLWLQLKESRLFSCSVSAPTKDENGLLVCFGRHDKRAFNKPGPRVSGGGKLSFLRPGH